MRKVTFAAPCGEIRIVGAQIYYVVQFFNPGQFYLFDGENFELFMIKIRAR